MLGKASAQGELFRSDYLYLDHVGARSIYAFLGQAVHEHFRDEDFAGLFCANNGRPGVPPSKLCVAMLLQTLENVSDHEAIERTAFDLRWKVALALHPDEKLCAKSTLQLFRAKLILHEQYGAIFERSVDACRRAGLLRREKLEVAIDTTPILGRGAVKDTFNLISDQIRCVVNEIVRLGGLDRDELVASHGLGRHFASSFKGAVELDWTDEQQKRVLVGQLVANARVVQELGRAVLRDCPEGADIKALTAACDLLAALLLQDVDQEPEDQKGPKIREGTAKDRVISTTDPEMRHGRKSASHQFEGHKGTVVVDTASGVILSTVVVPGNEQDGASAAAALEVAQQIVDSQIERVIGDTAYGTHAVREAMAAVVPDVIARTPPPGGKVGCFTINDFTIDPTSRRATCPAGKQSAEGRAMHRGSDTGFRYIFSRSDCEQCPLRKQCTTSTKAPRTLTVTAITEVQQEHRRQQQTDEFKKVYRRRVIVEHRIARLVQLGIRQARYFGRCKVAFQLAMAAAVANFVAAIAATRKGAPDSSSSPLGPYPSSETLLGRVMSLLGIHVRFSRLASRARLAIA